MRHTQSAHPHTYRHTHNLQSDFKAMLSLKFKSSKKRNQRKNLQEKFQQNNLKAKPEKEKPPSKERSGPQRESDGKFCRRSRKQRQRRRLYNEIEIGIGPSGA